MATLTQIRQAIAAIVQTNTPTEFFTYARMPDNPTTPCMIVEPADADFATVMQRGEDCWYLMIYILCARGDTESAQDELDEYIALIKQVLYDAYDLGLDDTQAFVTGMRGYGGSFESNRIPMVGAVLTMKVTTDGRKS